MNCVEKGKGRWVDGRNWSYDFEKDLPAGVVCTFTLKKTLRTLSGKSLTGKRKFTFNTGGPAVLDAEPYEGNEHIDENQRFIFTLNGDADEKSLIQNVYCSVAGIEERVNIRLVTGKEKEEFLRAIKQRKQKAPTVVFDCRRTFPPASEVKIVWGRGVKSLSGVATTQDQTFAYRTREPFFAQFSCMRENAAARCMPLSPMRI